MDVAVAFERPLWPDERLQSRVELTVDLARALGTDDIDVMDLDEVPPKVGQSALETGRVLVGGPDRISALLEGFEADATEQTHEERMRRFYDLLDRMRRLV